MLLSTTRKVKLPAICSRLCGRLRAEGALRVWGFVDESRKARLPCASDDAMDAVAGIILGDAGYDSGETFYRQRQRHVPSLQPRSGRRRIHGQAAK